MRGQLPHRAVADCDLARERGRRHDALHEQVVIAEHRTDVAGGQAPRAKRRGRRLEQSGVAGRVEVGPVVERVRIAGLLDPVVAGRAASGIDGAAGQHRERSRELVGLRVVDQVAALDDRAGRERADGAHRACQDVGGQRLVRAEGRGEGRSEPGQERDAGRRLGVEHVRVGDVGERCEHRDRRSPRSKVGAVDQRDAARHAQDAAPGWVAPDALERRAARRRPRAAAAGTEPERQRAAHDPGDRLAAGDRGFPHGSPATIGSRQARRATHQTAIAESRASPTMTAATSTGPAASASET